MPCTWKPFLLTPLREGRRIVSDRGRRCHVPISTHAPAGGATIVNVKFGSGTQFLLTPLREGRRAASAILSWSSPFLLTPLREGRPRPQSTQCWRLYFYSRPCGRGDANHEDAYAEGNISTHAPAGVDLFQFLCHIWLHSFFLAVWPRAADHKKTPPRVVTGRR